LQREPSKRQKDNERLKVEIRAVHKKSRKTYGSPRIHDDLKDSGLVVGKNRVARLMREDGIKGSMPKKFRRTTDSKHDRPIADNLLDRKFDQIDAPNRVWVGDITYIWTATGWLYLAVIVDLFSRRVVGYAIDDHMRTELIANAFNMAQRERDVAYGLLHHSDRGSQYASEEFREITNKCATVLSMSRKGNCWDNAVAESFFATLKKDLIHRQAWFSKASVITAVTDYIENFYNRQRKHSSIGFKTPAEYERLTMLAKVA